MLEVVVDGIIYKIQSNGGISRLFSEILPRMCDLDASLRVKFLIPRHALNQKIPTHPSLSYFSVSQVEDTLGRFMRPWKLWKGVIPRMSGLAQRVWIGNTSGNIWHSTAYTLPNRWRGPVVATVYDTIYERFADWFNGPWDNDIREEHRRYITRADAIICISETTRKDVEAIYGINHDKIRVVPLAASGVFRQMNSSSQLSISLPDERYLLYVGNRIHYKGFDLLLQAYSAWQERDRIALVVVGDDWTVAEMKCLAELKIKDRVRLYKKVDDETLCALYNRAAAFVYPSFYEGFGIPLLEAMSCGCPIVASRIASTLELANDLPIYFEPGDSASLVAALTRALQESKPSTRTRAGLEQVKNYSWDRTAKETLAVYRSLV